jgi:hypothetical protein
MSPALFDARLTKNAARLDKKASKCRTIYALTMYFTIVAGAVVAAASQVKLGTIPVTFVGLLITLLAGVEQVMHYGSRFRDAATAKVALDRERTLYSTESGEYAGLPEPEAFRQLVINCEQILFNERSSTTRVLAPQTT